MFRFRLERVLRHRQRQVDARSREVAEAQAALQASEKAVGEAEAMLRRSQAEAASMRGGRIDAGQLGRLAAWHEELTAQRVALEAEVDRDRQLVDDAQQNLQQAWRDREILERLRERQKQEWIAEEARQERRALDEIGAIRSALALRGHDAGCDAERFGAAHGKRLA